jgi:hypothetical protein
MRELDAVVVGSPVGDGLFDSPGLEILGEGSVDESGEFGVGGEAEGYELFDLKFIDMSDFGGGNEGGYAEALFEADDAVLELEIVDAALEGEDEEGQGDDDPPEMEVEVCCAVVDGGVDDDGEVERENREDEEVHGWIGAAVVLVGLGGGHGDPFVRLRRRMHSI